MIRKKILLGIESIILEEKYMFETLFLKPLTKLSQQAAKGIFVKISSYWEKGKHSTFWKFCERHEFNLKAINNCHGYVSFCIGVKIPIVKNNI